jgi:prepilin peptidase CpaA
VAQGNLRADALRPTRHQSVRPAPGAAAGEALALATAALVAAAVVWTARRDALPALPFAAAFLFAAMWRDVRELRIPNWLTGPALLGALVLGLVGGGAPGLVAAGAGAGVALALLFLPFAWGWLGAGDVKAAMVLGALWGGVAFLEVLWWMLVSGGALAAALLVVRGGFRDLLRRWRSSIELWLATRQWSYLGPGDGSAAATGIPFAVAMGLGAAAFQLWGLPWL